MTAITLNIIGLILIGAALFCALGTGIVSADYDNTKEGAFAICVFTIGSILLAIMAWAVMVIA